MRRLLIIGFGIAILVSGCRSMGPAALSRDRFDYTLAISDSVKNQALLNMVKIRYGDVPIFVDVSSVISQYLLENDISYGFGWTYSTPSATMPTTMRSPSIGGITRYAERPTISYSPLTGEKFTKSMLTPIPPSAIIFLVQSGKSVDAIFYLCVQSVNGIKNRYDGPMRSIPINPDFVELLTRMRRIQQSGMLGMRVQVAENKQATVFYFSKEMSPEIAEDVAWVKQKLGLNPQSWEFKVVYGSVTQQDEIAILSRSMMEILVQQSSAIDIPAEDIQQNRAYAVAKTEDPLAELMSVHVRSGKEKPADAFVSISYRDKWFWIEDTDFRSKQLFSGVILLLSLMEADKGANQPVITVPTG
jgi:hypothetical protein